MEGESARSLGGKGLPLLLSPGLGVDHMGGWDGEKSSLPCAVTDWLSG